MTPSFPIGALRTALCATLAAPALAQTPYLVSDVSSAPGNSSSPGWLTPSGDSLYFTAYEPSSGVELWRSDGTDAGTLLVKDLQPGTPGAVLSKLTVVGEQLYFCASDGATGVELWTSDGTDAGTLLVKDIVVGLESSSPNHLTPFQGQLVFQAFDPAHGVELWISDGTAAGTLLVKDIRPGVADSFPLFFTEVGGLLYFVAENLAFGREVWSTDGTPAGTSMLFDAYPGLVGSFPSNLIAVGGALFFTANDGLHGTELWTSDGTQLGTRMVKDIAPGPASSASAGRTVVDDVLYFIASEPTSGAELWRSDGTEAGTVLVKDIRPGPVGSAIQALCELGDGILLFAADDGTIGHELWRSDGTEAGTYLVADIHAGSQSGLVEDAFFADVEPSLVATGHAFFRANDGTSGLELWTSDGTTVGTRRIADIRSGALGSDPRDLRLVPGRIFFHANDGVSGTEPWAISAPQGTSFCAADGSSSGQVACPCANAGSAGRGCAHSQSADGATLSAFGPTTPDEVALTASGMLATSTAVFLQGTSALANGVVFGDGVRCVGGLLKLISVEHVSGGSASYPLPGDPSISAVSASLGNPIAPGSSRYYQVYYRDPALAFCPAPPGNSWNLTNAITVAW